MRQWLVAIRKVKGLSQYDVADQTGISRSYYGSIELGVRNPKPRDAKVIGNAMGFDWTLFYE